MVKMRFSYTSVTKHFFSLGKIRPFWCSGRLFIFAAKLTHVLRLGQQHPYSCCDLSDKHICNYFFAPANALKILYQQTLSPHILKTKFNLDLMNTIASFHLLLSSAWSGNDLCLKNSYLQLTLPSGRDLCKSLPFNIKATACFICSQETAGN